MGLAIVGCSYDFDAFDPGAGKTDASLGGTAGLAGSGGSGGAAGSGAAGSGGSAGSSGSAGTSGSAGAGGSDGGAGTAGSGGSAGTAGSAGSSGSAGAGGSAGDAGGPVTKAYTAAVADCVASVNPDPDACEAVGNAGKTMSVDANNASFTQDGGPLIATIAFVSFNLDNAFAGKTVTTVQLVLTVDTSSGSESSSSGEVWEVSSFTRPDLFNAVPSKVGGSPLAGNQGAVALGQEVKFTLPVTAAKAGQFVYFGVFPTNSNGIDYLNLKGVPPPKLEVTYQ